MNRITISIAGSGRVAGALSDAFYSSGHIIKEIISRNSTTAKEIAERVNAVVSPTIMVNGSPDILIMAVPDSEIAGLAGRLRTEPSTVIVHTSGSTDIGVFRGFHARYGVIYPLQTFTKGRQLNLANVHFFTEASDNESLRLIDSLIASVSINCHHIDSEQRRVLHLSAVFVSNFVNHMIFSGIKTAGKAGISPDVFDPLIRETVEKAIALGTEEAQTGPAVRNDNNTITKHIEMLSYSDDLKNLYRIVSDSIISNRKSSYNE